MRVRFTAVLIVAAILAGAVRAAEPITCAIVPDRAMNQSPVPDLLLAELAKKPDLAPVERAQVDKILAEQKLQLAMGAGDVDSRRRLGRLLHARLVIQLRGGIREIGGQSQPFMECVISESAHGLRLVRDIHGWNPAAVEQETGALAADVDAAIAKLRQQIKWIFAVPPFESQDLTHRRDHMQRSLAEALIGRLAAQPSVQVVEIEEARALADEARLTSADPTVRPLLSFFVNGKYRNEGEGAALRTNIEVELIQSGRKLDARQGMNLETAAIPEFLGGTLNQFFAKATQAQAVPFDVKRECAEMEKRAAQFERIGEWDNAFSLLETSLMLQPDRPEIDRRLAGVGAGAIKSLSRSTTSVVNPNSDKAFEDLIRMSNSGNYDPEAAKKAIADVNRPRLTQYTDYQNKGSYEAALTSAYALYLRGLEHFEIYLRSLDVTGLNKINLYSRTGRGRQQIDDAVHEWKFAVLTADYHLPAEGTTAGLKAKAQNERQRMILSWLEGASDKDLPSAMGFIEMRPTRMSEMDRNIGFDPIAGNRIAKRRADPTDREIQLRIIKLYLRNGTVEQLCNSIGWYNSQNDYGQFLAQVAALGPEGKYLAEYGRIGALEGEDRVPAWTQFVAKLASANDLPANHREGWKKQAGDRLVNAQESIARTEAWKKKPKRMVNVGPNMVMGVDEPETKTTKAPPATVADPDIEFIPLTIWKDPLLNGVEPPPAIHMVTEKKPPVPNEIRGWIDCGNGVEALWSMKRLMAMRAKDRIELLTELKPWSNGRNDIVHDGKNLWLNDANGLKAIDPATGAIVPIKLGPEAPGDLWISAMGVNKLCMMGYSDRTWCGVFDYQGGGKYKLDIFHEARLLTGDPRDPGLAFQPGRIKKTTGPAAGEFALTVWRELPGRAGQFPLIIDPFRRSVSIARDPADPFGERPFPTLSLGAYSVILEYNGAVLTDNAGRRATLKGRIPAWIVPRVAAVSHYYGPIVLTSTGANTANAWQIVMRRKPEAIMAATPTPAPASTAAPNQRPPMRDAFANMNAIQGHNMVLRVYPANNGGNGPFQKIEAAVRAGGVEIEQGQAAQGSFMMMSGEDQTDTVVRDFVGRQYGLWMAMYPVGRGSDAPITLRMTGRPMTNSQIALVDAEGRPLANLETTGVFQLRTDPRNPRNVEIFRPIVGRTDKNGMVPPRMGGSSMGMGAQASLTEYVLNDPKIGLWGVKPVNSGTPIVLPITAQSSPGELNGQVVDDAGMPIEEAEIRLDELSTPDGAIEKYRIKVNSRGREGFSEGQYLCRIITGADGKFRMCFPREDGKNVPSGSKYKITVQLKGLPVMNAVASNERPQTIKMGKGPLDCKITARDGGGQNLAYEQFRDCWLVQELDGFPNPTSPAVNLTLPWQEAAMKLWPGRYRLMGGSYESTGTIEVKDDGTAELAFTVQKKTTGGPTAPPTPMR